MNSYRSVTKYLEIGKMNFMNTLAYLADAVMTGVFIGLIIFIFINLWVTVYGGRETVEGYTINQIIWYLVLAESIVVSGGRVIKDIGADIQEGNIAYALSKPYNYILYHFAMTMSKGLIRFAMIFFFGSIIAWIFVGPLQIGVLTVPFIVVAVLLAVVLNFVIAAAIGVLAFWFEDSSSFYFINQKLIFTLGGMLVPLEIFPIWLQTIAHKLPYSYIAFFPARLFVRFDMSDFFRIVGIQIGWIVLFIILTTILYKRGIKRVSINGG